MPLFRKKTDPIAERERALKAHIAALEGEIKDLNRKAATELAQPKLRSTARPQSPAAAAGEPAFEDLSRHHVKTAYESPTTPSHINELGVRKYDPMATLHRRPIPNWSVTSPPAASTACARFATKSALPATASSPCAASSSPLSGG
jgi:hypothetical protein